MEKYGILGGKLPHSMSPFIHNRLFALSGKSVEYNVYEYDSVEQFLRENSDLAGYNVTIPHKENIFRLCDSLDDSAKLYHAVNCVDSNGCGYNTDVDGYRLSVSKLESTFCGDTLLLGLGGVGKMIAKQYNPSKLTVAVRNLTEVKKADIHSFLGGEVSVVDIDNIPNVEYDLIVNATPVGMYPNIDCSPINKSIVMHAKAVYDTIYNPLETKLLTIAKECGVPCKNGIDMLVYQAVVAHKYWYGAEFDSVSVEQIIADLTEYLRG